MYEPTLEENLAATIAGDWRQSGDEMMADAHEWITDHPQEWQTIEAEVRHLVMRGEKFSMRVLVDTLAWRDHFKCRHALTAPFARILAQRVPGFADCCQMNRSKVDK